MDFLRKNHNTSVCIGKGNKTAKFTISGKMFLGLIFFSFLLISCSSDDDDTTIPVQNNITYAGNVKAILDGSCLDCHGDPTDNGAPMSLTTFDEAKEAVLNRDLIGRVANGSMPSVGTDLTDAQVQIIKDWEAGGFKQ